MDVLLDTGAGVNVVDSRTLESLRLDDVVEEFCGELRSVDGQPVTTKGIVRLKLHLGTMEEQEEFVVVPYCEQSVILGLKFLKKHKFLVDFGKNELSLPPLSPEPLKMMVVAWSDDESRCYQRSTDNSRESVETEHSRSAPSTQRSRVFESRDPRWDSGEKPPPRRWDAMIVDSEADFRMVSTTASDYRCDGSRCPIVTTMKPHQKTLFGNVQVMSYSETWSTKRLRETYSHQKIVYLTVFRQISTWGPESPSKSKRGIPPLIQRTSTTRLSPYLRSGLKKNVATCIPW